MENLKIDYDALEKLRSAEMEAEVRGELKKHMSPGQVGRIDSIRHAVLTAVVASKYEEAKSSMDQYVYSMGEYPAFLFRTSRYINHCKDLVSAIRTKRNLPGITSLSRSKQKELMERVVDHFDELKEFLRKVEMIERELKIDDMRSTVYFVRALVHSIFAVLLVAFAIEMFTGLGQSFVVVGNDTLTQLMDFVYGFL